MKQFIKLSLFAGVLTLLSGCDLATTSDIQDLNAQLDAIAATLDDNTTKLNNICAAVGFCPTS